MALSRIRSVAAVAVAVLALGAGLTACSENDDTQNSAADTGASAGFPVTIDHLFGSTTIKAKPERVVTLGGGDMEASIALGVVPVAGADWFGNPQMRGWVKTALGDRPAPKLIQASEPKYEEIAALKPDLIVYINTVNDKKQFDTLNAIAPTIAAPAGTKNVYGVPWQDQVREIAKATGTATAGEQVVKETETLVSDTAKANPDFAGKVITAGVYSADSLNAWLPSDPRMRLLTSLGFKSNPQIDAMDNGDFYVKISPELTPRLDADLIFMAALDGSGKLDPAVVNDKVWNALPAVKAGRVAYWGGAPVINTATPSGEFSSAMSIGGPLGIKYALPKLVPMLKDALAGKG
ncbi:iron-siderophore ABC transporter substrate-binding protein [Kribbella jiaozuonensis]|uniref:Iron-siderophore ABC transporter substrate-binding protein n=1 Tax=Kribbella jiaozuonensis TaxID=2575441 RepID=A0A4U3M354_9ACTN|nr:iron-siderophore ABC transporter substrate-binding protein [Kribbella jiaozuonensis]TKK81716.1 iron-siderophore ABC transporter substrate-binding protein [Kribbella jiaozuonensis]